MRTLINCQSWILSTINILNGTHTFYALNLFADMTMINKNCFLNKTTCEFTRESEIQLYNTQKNTLSFQPFLIT